MKKVIFRLMACILVSLIIVFGFSKNALAQDIGDKMDLLLDLKVDLEKVEDIIYTINPKSIITILPEIALIRIENVSEEKKMEILNNDYIVNHVTKSGTLADFEVCDPVIKNLTKNNSNIAFFRGNLAKNLTDEELFDALSWHVDRVTNNRESLKISRGKNVDIALLDSGVDTTHPALQGKINLDKAKSYVIDDESLEDTNGHGTMVAGILSQVAPDATIIPYRVIGDSTGDSMWTIEAIIQATNDGNDLINMSLGTYKSINNVDEKLTIEAFQRATDYANSKGKIVIASAGNEGLDLDQYYENSGFIHLPGSLKGVISVSAENNNNLASYSNYGSMVTFTAPGGDTVVNDGILDINQLIYGLFPTYMDNGLASIGIPQGYAFSVGTSLSTPIVTAGIADLVSVYKENSTTISQDKVISELVSGCIDLGEGGYDHFYGNGLINIYSSLLNISHVLSY